MDKHVTLDVRCTRSAPRTAAWSLIALIVILVAGALAASLAVADPTLGVVDVVFGLAASRAVAVVLMVALPLVAAYAAAHLLVGLGWARIARVRFDADAVTCVVRFAWRGVFARSVRLGEGAEIRVRMRQRGAEVPKDLVEFSDSGGVRARCQTVGLIDPGGLAAIADAARASTAGLVVVDERVG